MAPLSDIGSKFLTQRLREIYILVLLVLLIISPNLSRHHALGLQYGFPPMLSALVAFYLCPSFLYQHVLLLWPMSTQCPCVQQYPPHVSEVFSVHPLVICLAWSVRGKSGSPVVSQSCLLELSGQCCHCLGEVGNGLVL